MSHVVMHSREDPSFLPMRTCGMGSNYDVVKAVASRRIHFGAILPFLNVTAKLKVNKIKDKTLSKAVLNIGYKVG